jgi:phospholipid transport system substrate-binding protein
MAATRRRIMLTMLAAASAWPVAVRAAEETASAFIQRIGRELHTVVDGATDEADRQQRLAPLLVRVVDVPAVARFCLGRYWRAATPAQQQDYVLIFTRVLIQAVAMRIGIYQDDTAAITMLPEITKPDGVYVPTVVQSAGEAPTRVTWVVDTASSPFHIVDVQAEGMSMRLSERADFTAFLDHHDGDIAAFLTTLRDHAGANVTAPPHT